MKKSKRICALLLASVMALPAVSGCAKNNNGSGGGTAGNGVDVSLDHSYKAQKIDVGTIYNAGAYVPMGDKVFIQGTDEWQDGVYAVFDIAGSTCSVVDMNYVKSAPANASVTCGGAYWDSAASQLCVLFTGMDATGRAMEPTIEVYDGDLNYKESHSLSGVVSNGCVPEKITANPAGGFFLNVQDNSSGNYVIYTVDSGFKKVNEIQTNAMFVTSFFTSKDAAYVVCTGANGSQLNRIDGAAASITPVPLSGISGLATTYFPSQDSRYDFFFCDENNLVGVSLSGNTTEPVMNWVNSDFIWSEVHDGIANLPDGRFLVNAFSNGYESVSETWLMTERPADDFKNTTMLSMSGFYIDSAVTKAVQNYNRTHTDSRIAVLDYSKYMGSDFTTEEMDKAIEKMKTDMTNGVVADIICTRNLPFESFCSKGVFEDLTDFTNQLSPDEYFTNVLEAVRYEGKQYQVCSTFSIETIMGKKELIGDKEGVSFEELMQLVKSAGPDVKPFGTKERSSLIKYLIGQMLNSFVDTKAGTCNFNTPEFIEMLEFTKTLPSEIDLNNMDFDEELSIFIKNKGLLHTATLDGLHSSYTSLHMMFDDAEVTYLGYPVSSKGGNGSLVSLSAPIALSANSKNKEKCKDFLSYMLSYEYQSTIQNGFPINRKAFEVVKENDLKPRMEKDEKGNLVEAAETAYVEGVTKKIPRMTSDYADKIESLILGAKDSTYSDAQVISILEEEANHFFNGDQDAAKAAENIQNRVSLYLSEQMK